MSRLVEYINLLEAVSGNEISAYEVIRRLNLELDSDERLEVRSFRTTKEVGIMLKALAEKYHPNERRGIHKILIEAILSLIAIKEASAEELLQIREVLRAGYTPPLEEEEYSPTSPPAVSPQLSAPKRVTKMFKELVLALSEISSHSGVANGLGTVYGVLMADPVYLPALLKVIQRVAGTDRRTLVRWVRELYEWNVVEYYVGTSFDRLISLEEAVEVIRDIAFKLAEAEYRFTDPEKAREEAFRKALLRHLGISLNRPNIRLIFNAVRQGGPVQLVDEAIRNALFRTMVMYPHHFRFRLFKDVVRNAPRKAKPFAVLKNFDGSVLVEGYYVKDFVVSRKERVIARAFVFRAVNRDGEEVSAFRNGLSTRLFVVYGDEVSATHLLYTVVIPELEGLGFEVDTLRWFDTGGPLTTPVGGVMVNDGDGVATTPSFLRSP
ncbi:protein of unknown function (plasmid) [Thermococcus nautili]|uniref:hypothetical protein n=1 Tax=Thermococcus nautili TaxID=195522 RepID=UPI0025534381|nr:hypothetical protein [Thermococcus nautili]CAI1494173.1 protein of unknown function [Thermococcus nautili]